MSIPAEIVEILTSRGESLSIAESLTGGALSSAIVDIPGASHVLRGTVIAYATEIKIRELAVPSDLIDSDGVVSESVALAMAEGVRSRMGTTWAISTTGVAGPGAHDGTPAGTVWIAIIGPKVRETVKLALEGDRYEIGRAHV